ncbi:MAG: RHS repeat-associated core domain-containing protein, partial [Fibrella sp.]|nr:RHS repeat-associated core domain-containing protein [Armatimonadota bacterium]
SERTNGTGQVLTRHIADAYGNTSAYDAVGTPLAQLSDPYSGFGGKYGYYTDVETGLILCTFRYYDQNTGRWINQDPIRYQGGVNLYGYVAGNPINAVDPSGLVAYVYVWYGKSGSANNFPDYIGNDTFGTHGAVIINSPIGLISVSFTKGSGLVPYKDGSINVKAGDSIDPYNPSSFYGASDSEVYGYGMKTSPEQDTKMVKRLLQILGYKSWKSFAKDLKASRNDLDVATGGYNLVGYNCTKLSADILRHGNRIPPSLFMSVPRVFDSVLDARADIGTNYWHIVNKP